MWRYSYAALKILVFCAGVFLLYVGAFLKEDSEGKLQNSLEALWVSITDQQSLATSKNTAFLRTIASLVTNALDHLLGERLFSLRALAVSCMYSLGSIFLTAFSVISLGSAFSSERLDSADLRGLAICFGIALGFLCLGTLQVQIRRPPTYGIWYVAVLILAVATFFFFRAEGIFDLGFLFTTKLSPAVAVIAFASTLFGGIAFDFVFIAATRYVLRRSSQMSTALNIAKIVLVNILIGGLLVALPAYFLREPSNILWPDTVTERVAGMVGASNLVDLLVSLLFVLAALLLLAHRLVWPLLENPVYTLQRIGVIGRRKLLVSVGFMMLAFATGVTFERLQKLFDSLSG
jgi:hypothetical protein